MEAGVLAPPRFAAGSIARTPGADRVVSCAPDDLLDRLAVAATADAREAYLLACAGVQLWADLSLVAAATAQPLLASRQLDEAVRRQAAAADEAARRFVRGLPPLPHVPTGRTITLEGPLGRYRQVLDAALAVTVPECCGYNIADPAICADDARWLAARLPPHAPTLVIGIRGGGAYLAPIWAAALAAATPRPVRWGTVRPLGAAPRRDGYHPRELARLPDPPPSDGGAGRWEEIVVVDDLPDSGDTVGQLVAAVRPRGARLWSASVGRVASHPAGKAPSALRHASSLRPRDPRPLWMCLAPADQSELRGRLEQAAPGCLGAGEVAVHRRSPTREARYGAPDAWLAWSDPALATERRRLVNPRKTPLVVTGSCGQPLLHLRFVGEAPFGAAEHQRAARLATTSPTSWFVDGYRIARHVEGLRPVRDLLEGASGAVLVDECAAQLRRLAGEPVARIRGEAWAPVGAMLRRRLALLRQAFGVPGRLPRAAAWIVAETPPFVAAGQLLRSSLRHADGAWHWQADSEGRIHRFHLEAGWGGISWPGLEVASFALGQGLDAPRLDRLLAGCDDVARRRDVAASLPTATLLALDAIYRAARRPAAVDVDRVAADLAVLLGDVATLSELLHA